MTERAFWFWGSLLVVLGVASFCILASFVSEWLEHLWSREDDPLFDEDDNLLRMPTPMEQFGPGGVTQIDPPMPKIVPWDPPNVVPPGEDMPQFVTPLDPCSTCGAPSIGGHSSEAGPVYYCDDCAPRPTDDAH